MVEVDRFYVALFSAFELICCAFVACDSDSLTSFLKPSFLSNIANDLASIIFASDWHQGEVLLH